MRPESRTIAVGIAGFCAFLNLYSPQALLPVLARELGAGAAEISSVMTASVLAVMMVLICAAVTPKSRDSSGSSACGE